jgi:hypothetical protein
MNTKSTVCIPRNLLDQCPRKNLAYPHQQAYFQLLAFLVGEAGLSSETADWRQPGVGYYCFAVVIVVAAGVH